MEYKLSKNETNTVSGAAERCDCTYNINTCKFSFTQIHFLDTWEECLQTCCIDDHGNTAPENISWEWKEPSNKKSGKCAEKIKRMVIIFDYNVPKHPTIIHLN